jgi:hypothetical protein
MGLRSDIRCNNITNLYEGVYYFGIGAPSTLYINTIQDNNYGFYLNSGEIGPQGSSGYPSGNIWGNTAPTAGYDLYSNNSNGYNSRFYCDAAAWPTSGPFGANIEVHSASGPVGSCGSEEKMGLKMLNTPITDNTNYINNIDNEKIDFANYDTESKWLAKEGVYKYLLANKDSLKDKELLKLKEKWDGENFGIFKNIETSIANKDLETAAILNLNVKVSVKPEKALQDYYTVLISYRQHNQTLNKQELTDLTELAKQCPLEYGTAVYKARVLLRLFDNNEYANKCEIIPRKGKGRSADREENNGNNSKTADKQTNDSGRNIKVYPNPANNELTIEYLLEEGEKGEIRMYNSLGLKVNEYNLSNSSNSRKINLNEYSSGLYFYKIMVDGVVIKNDKLSIIK